MFHTPAHKNVNAPAGQVGLKTIPPYANTGDFTYASHGHNIVILNPLSVEAKAWCEENLPAEARSGFGYSIQPRYFANILDGIEAAGLAV
jgi:hypothetical protein